MINYICRHWRGEQSLFVAFWINLVGIRVLVFLAQNALAPAEGTDWRDYRTLIVIAVVIFHVALLLWQLVGVVRAAERHFAENGNMALVWGAQLGAVLMFMLTAVYALGAVQMSMPVPENVDVLAKMDEEHASQYELLLSNNEQVLSISGKIELGITRAMTSLLNEHVSIQTVVLNSDGGNIYEARGLAKLFAQRDMSLHVADTCASACTVAFIGGAERSANLDATFGFHQYRVDAQYTIIATDVEKEQQRDQQLFRAAGVAESFVSSVFSQPSTSMWWPELGMLVDAGFVHEVSDYSHAILTHEKTNHYIHLIISTSRSKYHDPHITTCTSLSAQH